MKEYLSRFTRQELLEKLDMAKTSNAPEDVKKAFIEGLENQLNMYSVNSEAIKDINEKHNAVEYSVD